VIITLYKLHNKLVASRSRRVEPVELVVSSESSCAVRQYRHSQMHGLDTSNVSSRAKWNLGFSGVI